MAKAKKVNKTDEIKKVLNSHPKMGPKAVSEKLTKDGVKVSPAYVSTIKSTLRRRTKDRPVGRPVKGDHVSLDAIEKGASFLEAAGGIEVARKILATLATVCA